MQYFQLTRDTLAPTNLVLNVLDYYKDNLTPITLSATEASFMKLWINQNPVGDETDPEFPSAWSPYATSWTPNFSVEGTNYIHIMAMDNVRNKSTIVNSKGVIFDKTAPVVTAVVIENDVDVLTNRDVTVRVTANDGNGTVSQVQKVTLSGDLDPSSPTEFVWTDTDRTNGYKDCIVTLTGNTDPSHRETKTVYATATDFAGNTGERKNDTVVLYTGGIDPVIVLKTPTDRIIGKHYGEQEFKLQLKVLTGIADKIVGYKVWGDFNDTPSATGTPEPSDWTTWPAAQSLVSLTKYLTGSDGNKTVEGAVRLEVGTIVDTVGTFAELTTGTNDGDMWKVTADETKGGVSTCYMWNEAEQTFLYFGILETGDANAYHELESVSVHHSEAVPTIVLSSDRTVVSDKENYNVANLTAAMTTSCNINEYKVVVYASEAAAQAGTKDDVSNVSISGTTEIPSGGSWTPVLPENKMVLAVAGEGQKYVVVYAKNLCDKWGKSNIYSINVDLTAPVGSITVQQYYNKASGFTASATDAGSGLSKMQCWVDSAQGTETPPVTSTEYDYAINPTAAQVDWTNVVEGDNYVHIKYTDEVGNSGVTHSVKFIYDSVAPIETSITGPAETNTTTVVVTLNASDPTSGMGSMKLYGDLSGAATADAVEWIPYSSSANVTLTNGDGNKTVNALFRDNAGNVTAAAVSCVIKLDTEAPAATIVLYKGDDSAPATTYTNTVNLRAHVGATDTLSEIVQYKIWGNITSAATEEEAEWKTYVREATQTYMSVPFALTTGDGLKTIYVKVKDKPGNISTQASATITLDTTLPEINVTAVDYNVISEVHEPRLTASGQEITGTFADKMTFKFSCGDKLVEWKVCVNERDQQASTAEAIGDANGSINVTGTTLAANTEVTVTIMGKDFSATSKVNNTDGVYEVITYGKDEANNWSAIHAIEV